MNTVEMYNLLASINEPTPATVFVVTETSFPGKVFRESVLRCLLGFELDKKFYTRAKRAYKKEPNFRPLLGKKQDTLEQLIYDGPIVCQSIETHEMFIRLAIEEIMDERFFDKEKELERGDFLAYVMKKNLPYFMAPFPRKSKKPIWFNYKLSSVKTVEMNGQIYTIS